MAKLDRIKLTSVTWDTDEDPLGLQPFMNHMGSIVAATEDGPPIQRFLEQKLGISSQDANIVASFLTADPDFQRPEGENSNGDESPAQQESGVGDAESFASSRVPTSPTQSAASGGSTFQLEAASGNYYDLSEKSRYLDAMLYNILRMNVKGSKSVLLDCVDFPSYIQGMCVLYKHVDISRTSRKTDALLAFDNFDYRGNVQKFQLDFINLYRELKASKVTIEDWVMCQLMKSLRHNKTMQYKIAEDINMLGLNERTNLYDWIHKYCAAISAVGDGNLKVVKLAQEKEKCEYCGFTGHTVDVCRKKKAAEGKGGQGAKGGGKGKPAFEFRGACHNCGVTGHKAANCPKKANVVQEESAPAAAQPAIRSGQTGMTQDAMVNMINSIASGQHKINMVLSGGAESHSQSSQPSADGASQGGLFNELPCSRANCPCTRRWGKYDFCCLTCARGTPCSFDVHSRREPSENKSDQEPAIAYQTDSDCGNTIVGQLQPPVPSEANLAAMTPEEFNNWEAARTRALQSEPAAHSTWQQTQQLIQAQFEARQQQEAHQRAIEERQQQEAGAAVEAIVYAGIRAEVERTVYLNGQQPVIKVRTTHSEVGEIMKEAGEPIPTLKESCVIKVSELIGKSIGRANDMRYVVTSAEFMQHIKGGDFKPPLSTWDKDKELKFIHPSDWPYLLPLEESEEMLGKMIGIPLELLKTAQLRVCDMRPTLGRRTVDRRRTRVTDMPSDESPFWIDDFHNGSGGVTPGHEVFMHGEETWFNGNAEQPSAKRAKAAEDTAAHRDHAHDDRREGLADLPSPQEQFNETRFDSCVTTEELRGMLRDRNLWSKGSHLELLERVKSSNRQIMDDLSRRSQIEKEESERRIRTLESQARQLSTFHHRLQREGNSIHRTEPYQMVPISQNHEQPRRRYKQEAKKKKGKCSGHKVNVCLASPNPFFALSVEAASGDKLRDIVNDTPSGGKPRDSKGKIVINLCDGMGASSLAMKKASEGTDMTSIRVIGVEIDETARKVAQNANSPTLTFPGIDHEWHVDVFDITKEDIASLGANAVGLTTWGAPCQDHSKNRLIAGKDANGKPYHFKRDPRKGMDGERGKVMRQCLLVQSWIDELNPDSEHFIENHDFSDMEADWKEFTDQMGLPYVVNAEHHSATKRVRAYWTNINVHDENFDQTTPPVDADACMDKGRRVVRYQAYGKDCVRSIGASWKGDVDNPEAWTNVPVMVEDDAHEQHQHIRPHEAEKLMGMPAGCTNGQGVTAKDRLTCIGNSWDINVAAMFLKHSKVVTECRGTAPSEAPQPFITTAGLSAKDAQLQTTLVVMHQSMQTEAFAEVLCSYDAESQNHFLDLVGKWYALNVSINKGSVLDSGSSRHLDPRVHVVDPDNVQYLTGFEGSVAWTQGMGYLPLQLHDENTGESFPMDMDGVDKLEEVVSPVLSMGKLLRLGWTFTFGDFGREMYAVTPSGAHKIRCELGTDDVIRIPHEMRTGSDTAKLPASSPGVLAVNNCFAVQRTMHQANSEFLHHLLNHASPERVYATLQNTKGYKATRLPGFFCEACARANARQQGLSHKVHNQNNPELTRDEAQFVGICCYSCRELAMPVNMDRMYEEEAEWPEEPDEAEMPVELQYVAPTAGRDVGIQAVPRFQLYSLKPFEVMFCDNKDYPCEVRGSWKTTFVLICYKTRAKFKVDIRSKTSNGNAFREIVAMNQIHKLPHKCRIYTDGCGSMAHVKEAAIQAGIDCQRIPPHQQSLNEAEKVCDHIWAAARVHLVASGAPDMLFGECVSYVLHVDLRTATSASRENKTPYEMIRGTVPDISGLRVWFTKAFAHVPKAKQNKLKKEGLPLIRAETGRLIGYQGPFSTTAKVLLSGNRTVYSYNVTYNPSDYAVRTVPQPGVNHRQQTVLNEEAQLRGGEAPAEEARDHDDMGSPIEEAPEEELNNPLYRDRNVTQEEIDQIMGLESHVSISPIPETPPTHYEWNADESPDWNLPGMGDLTDPQPRARPRYAFVAMIEKVIRATEPEQQMALMVKAFDALEDTKENPDVAAHQAAARYLALHAQKDMSWNVALNGPRAKESIDALDKEWKSLTSTILEEVNPGDPDYETAVKEATPGRFLLDEKRSSDMKVRGIKQGFKEDKSVDGPNFNYYAHVVKFITIRMILLRAARTGRALAIKDVSTAFLQSRRYPNGMVKWICFKHPVTGVWHYFRQLGPIYGEASAPVRWEDTVTSWLQEQGFIRGCNEPCGFYHPDRDLVELLYVDDNLEDGQPIDVEWISSQYDKRFKCKDTEYLTVDSPLDYLGMEIEMDSGFTYIHMEKYVQHCLQYMELKSLKTASTPIDRPIDPESPPLKPALRQRFLTLLGMVGWLVNTCRPDIAYAHSRIGQHTANPTESSYDAIIHVFRYLKGTPRLGLAQQLSRDSKDLNVHQLNQRITVSDWRFYSDSDHAGNTEPQNKRRCQNGFVAMCGLACVGYYSKVTSVAMANSKIKEAHADTSSAAGETYAAGNATHDMLQMSYIAEELNIEFPSPMVLEVDNTAAEAFASNTALKTSLKHIDTRQEWVRQLRDSGVVKVIHVDTESNLADIMTKILPVAVFTRLRDRMMIECPRKNAN